MNNFWCKKGALVVWFFLFVCMMGYYYTWGSGRQPDVECGYRCEDAPYQIEIFQCRLGYEDELQLRLNEFCKHNFDEIVVVEILHQVSNNRDMQYYTVVYKPRLRK